MTELEQTFDFIDFAECYRVEPVIANLTRENHEAIRSQVEVNHIIVDVFEMHCGPTL